MTNNHTVKGSDIMDDYMFQNVMEDKVNCQVFLDSLFPDKKFKVIDAYPQKRIWPLDIEKPTIMDILAKDDKGVQYNLEMQVKSQPFRDERAEFYSSRLVQKALYKGENYDELRRTYVIFIFASDPFDENLRRYTIKNSVFESKRAHFNGKSAIIYLNSQGTKGKITTDLQDFLNLMEDKPVSNGKAIRQIQETMENVGKTKDWRQRSMSIQYKIDAAKEAGIKQGSEKTRLEDIKKLIRVLRLDGNNDSVILNKSLAFYGDDFSKEELSHIITETK